MLCSLRFEKLIRCLIVLVLFVISTVDNASFAGELKERVAVHTLENGLRILVYPRDTSPTFSGRIIVNAGSSDERLGITGIAHMFEHMAFKGTTTIGALDLKKEMPLLAEIESLADELTELQMRGQSDTEQTQRLARRLQELNAEHDTLVKKNEFDAIYKRNGGQGLNASTSRDFTNYFINLPSNRLELFMWLESDRLLHPVMREFYTERDVVLEERNMRVENNPNGKLWEVFLSSVYQSHPYGYPTLGWVDDMRRLTLKQALEFRRQYYTPSNMILVLVGDLDPEQVFEMAEKYFGPIPAGSDKALPIPASESPQIGERRFEIVRESSPVLMIGYHKKALPHRDDQIADVTQMILSEGRTSRLYKSLVLEKQLATGVYAFTAPGDRYDNLFMLYGIPRAPHGVQEVEEAIYEELDLLSESGPSELELQRVRNKLEADNVRGLSSNYGLSSQLATMTMLTGDPYYLDSYVEQLKTVTAEEVQDFIKRILVKQNRTVGWITPEG